MRSVIHHHARQLLAGVRHTSRAPLGYSNDWCRRLAETTELGESSATTGPVLLVHGWGATPAAMIEAWRHLRHAGWDDIHPHRYISQLDNLHHHAHSLADHTAELAERTGQPVHLVGWSLGGVLARAAAESHGGRAAETIASITTIASPHQGLDRGGLWTKLAPLGGRSAAELTEGSAALERINTDQHANNTAGLTPIAYLTIGSTGDRVVDDARSRIDGHPHVTVDGYGHLEIVDAALVWRRIIVHLAHSQAAAPSSH